jgi:hypothetical protein
MAMELLILAAAQAASPAAPLEARVRAADASFWAAFNACDRGRMASLLDPHVEFYHDKTGATVSRERVAASFMDGPCGSNDLHMRRAPVAASLHYDPIPGYGGMLTGRHRFYARSGDQPEKLTTEARFAVVWHQVGDQVLISRVLSFDHGDPAPDFPLCEVAVAPGALARFVGHYASDKGDIDISLSDGRLQLASGGLHTPLVATGPAIFRAPERPLEFRFGSGDGRAGTVEVWENGARVVEAKRAE